MSRRAVFAFIIAATFAAKAAAADVAAERSALLTKYGLPAELSAGVLYVTTIRSPMDAYQTLRRAAAGATGIFTNEDDASLAYGAFISTPLEPIRGDGAPAKIARAALSAMLAPTIVSYIQEAHQVSTNPDAIRRAIRRGPARGGIYVGATLAIAYRRHLRGPRVLPLSAFYALRILALLGDKDSFHLAQPLVESMIARTVPQYRDPARYVSLIARDATLLDHPEAATATAAPPPTPPAAEAISAPPRETIPSAEPDRSALRSGARKIRTNPNAARKELATTISNMPDSKQKDDARLLLGQAHLRAGRAREALKVFMDIKNRPSGGSPPGDIDVWIGLAADAMKASGDTR